MPNFRRLSLTQIMRKIESTTKLSDVIKEHFQNDFLGFQLWHSFSLLLELSVHDHYYPYYQLSGVEHGLCNAHHLRELKALMEIEKEYWANSMSKLLLVANKYKHNYSGKIPPEMRERLEKVYDSIVERGLAYHESLPELSSSSNRGRKKRSTGHNLLIRLSKDRQDVLRFLRNEEVPFTNNQAERDVRMMKCKQKISGSFRTRSGAVNFALIRSVISTELSFL